MQDYSIPDLMYFVLTRISVLTQNFRIVEVGRDFFFRLNNPSCLSLSLDVICTSPFTGLNPVCPCFSCTEKARPRSDIAVVPHQCWIQRKDHQSWPAGNALPYTAQHAVHFLCHEDWIWGCLMLNLSIGPLGPSLQSCFAAFQPPACSGEWGYLSPAAGLGTSFWWTSYFCQSISPPCWGPSEWQHTTLVYWLHLPVFYRLQICWGCTLPHHPGHQGRCWTVLDPAGTLGAHHQFLCLFCVGFKLLKLPTISKVRMTSSNLCMYALPFPFFNRTSIGHQSPSLLFF